MNHIIIENFTPQFMFFRINYLLENDFWRSFIQFVTFLARLKDKNAWQDLEKQALRKSFASKENPHSILIIKTGRLSNIK